MFYGIYLIIQLADLILMRKTIKSKLSTQLYDTYTIPTSILELHIDIYALRQQPISAKRNEQLRKNMAQLIDLESNEDMSIRKLNANFYKTKNRASSNAAHMFTTPVLKTNTNDVDYVFTKTILHNKKNPKNQFLFSEFFHDLNPIDTMDWRLSNTCGRFMIICKSPLIFFTKAMVPEVNYEHYKHGWSKLLNCMQIITTPFIIITIVHCKQSIF